VPPALDGAVISGSRRVQRGLKVLGRPVMVALQVSPSALRLDDARLSLVQCVSRRARLRLGRLCANQCQIAYFACHPSVNGSRSLPLARKAAARQGTGT